MDLTEEDGRQAKDAAHCPGRDTRERVLDAAERCFAERGFDAISIRQIAREADVDPWRCWLSRAQKQELSVTVLETPVEP